MVMEDYFDHRRKQHRGRGGSVHGMANVALKQTKDVDNDSKYKYTSKVAREYKRYLDEHGLRSENSDIVKKLPKDGGLQRTIMPKYSADKYYTSYHGGKNHLRNGDVSPSGKGFHKTVEVTRPTPPLDTGPVVKKIMANQERARREQEQREKSAVEKQAAVLAALKMSLQLAPEMPHAMKLIDSDAWMFCDAPIKMLTDQPDFLTVGVLGFEGVGKSTLMTHLAGNNSFGETFKKYIFKPQAKDVRELGEHQTGGVHIAVTPERVILLDTQPIISASILHEAISQDKKFSSDYMTLDNGLETQSLQVMSFLMTVCNVIFVVMDWFVDLNLIKLLQTAEMLRPNLQSTPEKPDPDDYYPKIVFVLNKATRADFNTLTYRKMQRVLEETMKKSKLRFTGFLSMETAELMVGKVGEEKRTNHVNLFLLPFDEPNQDDAAEGKADQGLYPLMAKFRGHPSHEECMRRLRKSLFGIERESLIPASMRSERNWFHFAARSWESIKKSNALMTEYNRLLP